MHNVPDNFYRVSVKALILDENKNFLLVKEKTGLWELLGGGLDFGEEPRECLKRELKEEAGLETIYISNTPKYFITDEYADKPGVWKCIVVYEVRVKDYNFTPSDECVELKFFNKKEAIELPLFTGVPKVVEVYNPENH